VRMPKRQHCGCREILCGIYCGAQCQATHLYVSLFLSLSIIKQFLAVLGTIIVVHGLVRPSLSGIIAKNMAVVLYAERRR
jgi:hypothetical protein